MNKKMTESLWIAIILIILQVSSIESKDRSKRPKNTMLSGGLISTGEVTANSVTVELENNLYALRAMFKRLRASNIVSKIVKTQILTTPLLIPNNDKNIINISSYLQVKGEIKFDDEKTCTTAPKKKPAGRNFPSGTSFLQLNSVSINGVRQFQLVKEENMNDVNESLNHQFLNLIAKNHVSIMKKDSEEILVKKILPVEYDFTHMLIESSFEFVNAIWNGNTAFIKINGHYYWMDQHNWTEEQNIANKSELFKDAGELLEKWSNPIRIIYRKPSKLIGNKISIEFGFKYNPSNNLTALEFKNCNLSESGPISQIFNFKEMYISLK